VAVKRYLIIGDGIAGITAAQCLRDLDPKGEIHICSDDPALRPYFRAALTNYLMGDLLSEEKLWAVPDNCYEDLEIRYTPKRVMGIDTNRATVLFQDGSQQSYDRLLIATGSRCRPPSFVGKDLVGVMTFRTLQDVNTIMKLIKRGLKRAVITGGGPLALEWAQGLQHRGVYVTLLLRGDHLMSGVLDKTGSDLVLARLRMSGMEVIVNDEVNEALADRSGNLKSVRTKRGSKLPCQLLGVAFGVIRNTELLKDSGIEIGPNGGVLVDEHLRTSASNVFAAGDIIELRAQDQVMQLWEPAQHQGRFAAHSMCDRHLPYNPGPHYMATRLYDLDFASIGQVNIESEASQLGSAGRIAYRKLFFQEDRLVGALLLGERKEAVRRTGRKLARLIEKKVPLGSLRKELLEPGFSLDTLLVQETSAKGKL
jgi:NAD(P)H-nitrite reductase large subunit